MWQFDTFYCGTVKKGEFSISRNTASPSARLSFRYRTGEGELPASEEETQIGWVYHFLISFCQSTSCSTGDRLEVIWFARNEIRLLKALISGGTDLAIIKLSKLISNPNGFSTSWTSQETRGFSHTVSYLTRPALGPLGLIYWKISPAAATAAGWFNHKSQQNELHKVPGDVPRFA